MGCPRKTASSEAYPKIHDLGGQPTGFDDPCQILGVLTKDTATNGIRNVHCNLQQCNGPDLNFMTQAVVASPVTPPDLRQWLVGQCVTCRSVKH